MPPKLLVIDDEPDIRKVLMLSLGLVGGFEVVEAASGEEGLTLARALRPDVVLLDVMMPDMDGPETLARLRADPVTAAVAVIFLTAKTRASETRGAGDARVLGVLAKPFDPMTISDDVRRLLRGRTDVP